MTAFLVTTAAFILACILIACVAMRDAMTNRVRQSWIWRAWWRFGYRVWCWVWNLGAASHSVPNYRSIAELSDALRGQKYEQDPLRGALDFARTPEAVQNRLDRGMPLGDCDDWARYSAVCIARLDGYEPRLVVLKGHMTVIWKHGEWWSYDYGTQRGPYRSGEAAVHAICQQYWKEDATWMVFLRPDLSLELAVGQI